MLPSLVPMLSHYRRSVSGPNDVGRRALPVFAGAGYFFVWALVGAVAYPLGVILGTAEMRWSNLARFVPIATGVILLLAGCIQVTRWKARLLEQCRNAPAPGQAHPSDAWSAWRHGLHLGVQCALCCSGFMIILLVAGLMNLGLMAILTTFITLERVAPWPKGAALVAGIVAIAVAALVIARAISLA